MLTLLTAEQFLAAVLAALRLRGDDYILPEAGLDRRFERAYEDLLEAGDALKVTPTFSFFTDPLHGDSITFREALLAMKLDGFIGPSDKKPYAYELKLDPDRAARYLKGSHLATGFLESVVRHHFPIATSTITVAT